MRIAFKALIKEMKVKSLSCGEKEVDLKLQFRPEAEEVETLNKLQKPDGQITVVIMDEPIVTE